MNDYLIKADIASFYDTATMLYKMGTEAVSTDDYSTGAKYYITAMINFSLTCEMALKYLLMKNEIAFTNTQDLITLFLSLPIDAQESFYKIIIPILNKDEKETLAQIKSLSQTLNDWKNLQSEARDFDINFLLIFATVLFQIVLSK